MSDPFNRCDASNYYFGSGVPAVSEMDTASPATTSTSSVPINSLTSGPKRV